MAEVGNQIADKIVEAIQKSGGSASVDKVATAAANEIKTPMMRIILRVF